VTDPAARPSGPHAFDDPTRDIRLPPPPGGPPLVIRPEWSSYAAREQPVPAEAPPTETAAAPTAGIGASAARRPLDALAEEPTDQLVRPGSPPRERTLELPHGDAAPLPVSTPAAPAAPVREGGRRWPWVLMALLPIIVIVGSGIWLFILLSHA
jgi:hypothetical protein